MQKVDGENMPSPRAERYEPPLVISMESLTHTSCYTGQQGGHDCSYGATVYSTQ